MPDKFLVTLRNLNRKIAIIVGLVLLASAAFVLLDIILRALGSSFGGTDEISGYVMAITTVWGMSFTLLELGHVRIDILRSRVAARGRVLFDLFALIVFAVTISVIAWYCWPVLERSLANLSRANTPLETPLWWVQLPWFLGWVWFALLSWLTLLASLLLFVRGEFSQAEAAIGVFAEQEQDEAQLEKQGATQ